MKKTRLVKAVLIITSALALLSPPGAAEQTFPLSHRQAGPIKIGMPVDELLRRFGPNNTRLVDRKLKGRFTAIEVDIRGNTVEGPSLVAEFSWWREVGWGVSRIIVRDPRFTTSEGAGVGTPYGALRHSHPIKMVGPGETIGSLAYLDSLEMAFGFPALAKRFVSKADALPDDVRADVIIVRGVPEFLEVRSRKGKKAR